MMRTERWVSAAEIEKTLHDEEALSALQFYSRYKRMGLPYGPWGENPKLLIEVVDVLEPLDRFYHPQVTI